MKTTVDIPDADLEEAMRLSQAKTKRAAIIAAIQDFNRRGRLAELGKYAGTCKDLIDTEGLRALRSKG
jgi:putative antitoxin of VapBC-like toxin-antitoxin system